MSDARLLPTGHTAVMAQRREPPDSLDFFPTPPWATRALCECVLWPSWIEGCSAWDPACGEGHMAGPLREYFDSVYATDIHDYGGDQHRLCDFTRQEDRAPHLQHFPRDWIITNPPFRLALDFALIAIKEARAGCALLVRSAWLEGAGRYERLFRPHPPAIVAQFAERVPMTKGRWDPDASTATAYAWVVWRKDVRDTRFTWIPPGQRTALTAADDAARFGVRAAAPLLEAAP